MSTSKTTMTTESKRKDLEVALKGANLPEALASQFDIWVQSRDGHTSGQWWFQHKHTQRKMRSVSSSVKFCKELMEDGQVGDATFAPSSTDFLRPLCQEEAARSAKRQRISTEVSLATIIVGYIASVLYFYNSLSQNK